MPGADCSPGCCGEGLGFGLLYPSSSTLLSLPVPAQRHQPAPCRHVLRQPRPLLVGLALDVTASSPADCRAGAKTVWAGEVGHLDPLCISPDAGDIHVLFQGPGLLSEKYVIGLECIDWSPAGCNGFHQIHEVHHLMLPAGLIHRATCQLRRCLRDHNGRDVHRGGLDLCGGLRCRTGGGFDVHTINQPGNVEFVQRGPVKMMRKP